jgi:antitoxin YqcF
MGASAENKAVAKQAWTAFGGTPNVRAFHHDTEELCVDILRCDDRPDEGVTSYSTVGLSDCLMLKEDGTEFPARLEIAGACATASELFPNILGSAAFNIMRTRRLCGPGSVMAGCVREYYPSTTVPQLYFTAPFLWEDTLRALDCGTKRVCWLLAIPISDHEQTFLRQHGDTALEDLFEEQQIDIFDLNRASVA